MRRYREPSRPLRDAYNEACERSTHRPGADRRTVQERYATREYDQAGRPIRDHLWYRTTSEPMHSAGYQGAAQLQTVNGSGLLSRAWDRVCLLITMLPMGALYAGAIWAGSTLGGFVGAVGMALLTTLILALSVHTK